MEDHERLKAENDSLTKSVAEIGSELFRFRRVFVKALRKLDMEDQAKYMSQFAWFAKRVEKAIQNADLRLIDAAGQKFDPGMAVTALNIDDFDPEDDLYIEQTMEPIIMKGDSIYKTGTVLLGRIEE